MQRTPCVKDRVAAVVVEKAAVILGGVIEVTEVVIEEGEVEPILDATVTTTVTEF
jgi:hypothetical protein